MIRSLLWGAETATDKRISESLGSLWGPSSLQYPVGWDRGVEQLLRLVGAADRIELRIQQPDLHQHRSLIPVDVLVVELVAAEIDDRDERDLDVFARGLLAVSL